MEHISCAVICSSNLTCEGIFLIENNVIHSVEFSTWLLPVQADMADNYSPHMKIFCDFGCFMIKRSRNMALLNADSYTFRVLMCQKITISS